LPLFPTVLQAHREDRVHPACLAIDVSTQTLCVHRTIYVTVTPGTTSRTRSVVSDFVLLLSKRFLPAFIDYGQGGGHHVSQKFGLVRTSITFSPPKAEGNKTLSEMEK